MIPMRWTMIRHSLPFLAGVLLTMATACSSDGDSTGLAPDPIFTTDSFSGELSQQGTVAHPFTVSTAGNTSLSLTSVGPLTTMALGLAITSWDGSTCGTAAAKNDNARAGSVALNGTAVAGNYCAQVYDSGNVPANTTVTYTIQVVHP